MGNGLGRFAWDWVVWACFGGQAWVSVLVTWSWDRELGPIGQAWT